MRKKHLNKLSGLCVSLLTAAALIASVPVSAAAADQKYISSIGTATGENGESDLLGRGFTVFHPMLSGKNGEGLWLGYQTTADSSSAITELQAEADGSFTWKTGGDKAPVLSVYFISANLSGEQDFNKVMPIANNGASAMRGTDGEPAVFNTDSGKGYLAVVHKDVWKNYIANVVSVTSDTKKDAITQLYKNGCEYYIDKNLSGSDSSAAYIGYSKTNDASKAVTDIIAFQGESDVPEGYEAAGREAIGGKTYYFTRNAKLGNPIVDLEPLESENETELGAKEISVMTSAGGDDHVTKPYILENAEYQKFAQSKDRFIMSDIKVNDGSATGLSAVSAKDGLTEKKKERNRLLDLKTIDGANENSDSLTKLGSAAETAAAEEETTVVTDKNEDEDEQKAENETVGSGTGTSYSDPGNSLPPWPAVVIPLIIVIAIPIATIIIRKRILTTRGGSNDKK